MTASKRELRLARLDERLKADGVLHLREAAGLLAVSEMTIRRDLASAADTFHYLGGYILPAQGERIGPYRLEAESDEHAEAKDAACRHAAALVRPGDTVFVDCGTTTVHLAGHLPADGPLTVVCYALNTAQRLAARPHVRMILLGGLFHPSAQTFSGEEALRTIEHLRINHAFLSAGGAHATHGVTCSNFNEVPIKQAAMSRALRRTLVVDASKLGQVRPAYFASLDQFDEVVTQDGVMRAAV